MRISIQQLRKIIKEEVTKAQKLGEAKLTPAETRKYFELLDDPKFKEFLRSSNMKLGRGERDVLSDIETDRMHRGRNPAHDDDIELPARPTTKRPRKLKEATRSYQNLLLDLEDLPIGGTLDLETFGGGDYEPGQLTITRTEDASPETGWDIDEDEGEKPFPLYTITDTLSDEESDPMPANRITHAIGEFAY